MTLLLSSASRGILEHAPSAVGWLPHRLTELESEDPRRREKHARRLCALSSSCGPGESGFGPNKATAYLLRSIVAHVTVCFTVTDPLGGSRRARRSPWRPPR